MNAVTNMPTRAAALSVDHVSIAGPDGPLVRDVSLTIAPGECLGLVGESGSGKTLTARAIADLLPAGVTRTGGEIATSSGHVGMVFQDPLGALNPVFTIRRTMREPVMQHHALSRRDADEHALTLLSEVGISEPERVAASYPHQLSGGLRQRVMIAAALACGPTVLLCDEPTTALDVTTQATILNLFMRLKEERDLAILFVSHDLAVVAQIATRVSVMYSGEIVESGRMADILGAPRHAYTAGLLRSIPSRGRPGERFAAIGGIPPRPYLTQPGCRFADRCDLVTPECRTVPSVLRELSGGHMSRCIHADKVSAGSRGATGAAEGRDGAA